MIELLSTYSIAEIIIFIIMIIIAIKEGVTLMDWVKDRAKNQFKKEDNSVDALKKLEEKNNEQDQRIDQILTNQQEMSLQVGTILSQVNNLISSDKDSIKAYITKEHHFFCYEAKWIDDYNLDVLERRYAQYKKEGGNSFVGQMMEDIRTLPRQPENTT